MEGNNCVCLNSSMAQLEGEAVFNSTSWISHGANVCISVNTDSPFLATRIGPATQLLTEMVAKQNGDSGYYLTSAFLCYIDHKCNNWLQSYFFITAITMNGC